MVQSRWRPLLFAAAHDTPHETVAGEDLDDERADAGLVIGPAHTGDDHDGTDDWLDYVTKTGQYADGR